MEIIELVKKQVSKYSILADTKNLRLSLNIDFTGDKFEVYSDGIKINRIISHLIDNAIKFTSKGTVGINVELDQSKIKIAISDTGIGISEDMMEIVIKPFRQVDFGTDRLYDGNGLGLSISKAFTELLNGSLHLYSEIGKGTIITIMIPVTDNPHCIYIREENPSFKIENQIQMTRNFENNFKFVII